MTKQELSGTLAVNIRQRRKALKLSIGALADRADVGEDYLGHVERAKKLPSIEVLAKIASGLAVDAGDLLRQESAPEPVGTVTRRLQTFLRGLNDTQKADVLAILGKLRRAERIAALRLALGA